MGKHDDPVLGSLSNGPDAELPPPALGLDAFDPIDEDDELVEDLRTVRVRLPHRRAIASDVPDPGPAYIEAVGEPDAKPNDEVAHPQAFVSPAAEPGLDTEPIAGRRAPVHEVTPPPRRSSPPKLALADRAVRPKPALEAARDAADREAAAPARSSNAAPAVPASVAPFAGTDVVRAAIAKDLGGAGQIFVLETHEVSAGPIAHGESGALDREILRALWRGHRAKFLADGNLERAATAAVVVQALERRGSLAVARVVARGRDHLAFVDVEAQHVIACLADAQGLAMAGTARSVSG
jgi:hypothetical protein